MALDPTSFKYRQIASRIITRMTPVNVLPGSVVLSKALNIYPDGKLLHRLEVSSSLAPHLECGDGVLSHFYTISEQIKCPLVGGQILETKLKSSKALITTCSEIASSILKEFGIQAVSVPVKNRNEFEMRIFKFAHQETLFTGKVVQTNRGHLGVFEFDSKIIEELTTLSLSPLHALLECKHGCCGADLLLKLHEEGIIVSRVPIRSEAIKASITLKCKKNQEILIMPTSGMTLTTKNFSALVQALKVLLKMVD